MRILFTGGGTGGHIFPILAVKREIENLAKEVSISPLFKFIGGTIEKRILEEVKREKIQVKKIISVKWRRYFSLKNFIDILKFPFSFIQALIEVWLFMPDVIFSKGGPGSLPVVIVGWLYQIPVIVHESDSVPGVSNKISSFFSKKIAISFKESEKFFPKKKTILTGHPIRQGLFEGSIEEAKRFFNLTGERKVILFLGGSQGAKKINSVLIDAIYKYVEKYEIIHICGPKNIKNVELLTKGILKKEQRRYYHLYPYLNEKGMALAYKAADIVVSRAGAGVIFETAALEKPVILLPLKGGAQDHQVKNAYYFARYGGGIVIEEINITPNFIFGRVTQLIENQKLYEQMKKNCKKLAKPEAAREVAKIILEIG